MGGEVPGRRKQEEESAGKREEEVRKGETQTLLLPFCAAAAPARALAKMSLDWCSSPDWPPGRTWEVFVE